MTDLKYWLWLTTRKGLGPAGALAVLDHFATAERAYYAGQEDYEALPLRPAMWRGLLDKGLEGADRILGDCDRLSLDILTLQDAAYPQRLRQIAVPPPVLYIQGRKFRYDEEVAIAVVGTRDASEYGEFMAQKLGLELAAGGALLVSGIAYGLDTCAIQGALRGGGPVVSVLAGGIDCIPAGSHNRYLAKDVAAVGALVSEYPPGTPHLAGHYDVRNRILSGLALGVVAVQCKDDGGGTMLTVNHAIDQDRDVFAVPNAVGAPLSQTNNRLIRQGAKLVESGRDILEEYVDLFPGKLGGVAPLSPVVAEARLSQPASPPPQRDKPQPREEPAPARERVPKSQQKARFTDDELAILAAIQDKALPADEVVERTQIPARYVLSSLTILQLQGALEEMPGRRFRALVELEP